jgi:hypothetical protein
MNIIENDIKLIWNINRKALLHLTLFVVEPRKPIIPNNNNRPPMINAPNF